MTRIDVGKMELQVHVLPLDETSRVRSDSDGIERPCTGNRGLGT